ncbi:MAG: hypothetical protein INQ03_14870 [Candidatus Heimdallarchaeota archaeon]|nr:hypothetical protein [Candidatus Heimdallarchaeota archaeon]
MSVSKSVMSDDLDEIINKLEKYGWISSYEIFYHNINRFKGILIGDNISKVSNLQSGYALRLISKSKRIMELSISDSMLHILNDLTEPKSTRNIIPITEFKQLQSPRMNAIMGDEGATIDFKRSFLNELQDIASGIEFQGLDQITRSIDLNVESRIIITTGSSPIYDTSMKSIYELSYIKLTNNILSVAQRQVFQRNLDFDWESIEKLTFEKVNEQESHPINARMENIKGIIIKPNVLGKIIALLVQQYLKSESSQVDLGWKKNYQLVDDPHRLYGYNSMMFDDEGTLTKSKILVEDGKVKDQLHDLQSSSWSVGGNGFRTAWYEPILRSYKLPINRNFTNLSLYGGVGRGEKFTENSGRLLVIHAARVFLIGTRQNIRYVIHASDCNLMHDDVNLGSVGNLTLTGSVIELMQYSNISSDLHQVVEKAISGAVYCGWAFLHSRYVSMS